MDGGAVLLVEGAKGALAGTPYQLIVAPADGPEYGALETLADGLVDGIIAVSNAVDRDWLEKLATRVPIVVLGPHDAPRNYDTVTNDDALGTRLAMQHLFNLGHRRIAHLTESETLTTPESGAPHAVRLQAYLDLMREAALDSFTRVARRGEFDARKATANLLSEPEPPTAILAGHDDIAIEALAALDECGYRYGDVSVVGYDNTDVAAHPLLSLTSVDQCGAAMGSEAVKMLLERIRGRTEPRQYVATPTLQVRRSSSPPPDAATKGRRE